MAMKDRSHLGATGGNPKGGVLGGLERLKVRVGEDGRPDRCTIVEDRAPEGFVDQQ